jgi:hypothetical protein
MASGMNSGLRDSVAATQFLKSINAGVRVNFAYTRLVTGRTLGEVTARGMIAQSRYLVRAQRDDDSHHPPLIGKKGNTPTVRDGF